MTHVLSFVCRTWSSRVCRCLIVASGWVGMHFATVSPSYAQGQLIARETYLSLTMVTTQSAADQPLALPRTTPGLSPRSKSDHYFVLPPCPVNQYTPGEIIAVPKDERPVLNATLKKGEAPRGTALFPNGCLVVIDPTQLDVGTYRFAVETADQAGNTATHALTVKLRPQGKEDADAIYAVRPPKAVDQYGVGDVLAVSQDRDGAIVRSEFVKGHLPAGTSLTDDGRVVVDDPKQLQTGQYAAWIATEDEQGGTTLFIITLTL